MRERNPAEFRLRDSHADIDVRALFHRLINQSGIPVAPAEQLEAKGADDAGRVQAAWVVGTTLAAQRNVRKLSQRTERASG